MCTHSTEGAPHPGRCPQIGIPSRGQRREHPLIGQYGDVTTADCYDGQAPRGVAKGLPRRVLRSSRSGRGVLGTGPGWVRRTRWPGRARVELALVGLPWPGRCSTIDHPERAIDRSGRDAEKRLTCGHASTWMSRVCVSCGQVPLRTHHLVCGAFALHANTIKQRSWDVSPLSRRLKDVTVTEPVSPLLSMLPWSQRYRVLRSAA